MLKTGVLSAGLLIMVMASFILTGHCYSATYYKYVDKDGTACFTDSRQSIPEAYKKKAIKITDEKENVDKKSKNTQIKADDEDSLLHDKKQELPSKERMKGVWTTLTNSDLFGPVAAIVLFLGLFIVIGKLGRSLGHKQISSVLRIALTIGVLVYLFHTHVEKMANAFTSLKKEVMGIAKQAEERNKEVDAAKDPLEPGGPRR